MPTSLFEPAAAAAALLWALFSASVAASSEAAGFAFSPQKPSSAFAAWTRVRRRRPDVVASSTVDLNVAAPSTVEDFDGPTPPPPDPTPTIVDPDDIPELQYDPDGHPIPYQPWRRGDTDGCEDPIEAPWRREAETLIRNAVSAVGGEVLDVTWYMAKCVISLDPDFADVDEYTTGPEIMVEYEDTEQDGPVYRDPELEMDDLDEDGEDVLTEEQETAIARAEAEGSDKDEWDVDEDTGDGDPSIPLSHNRPELPIRAERVRSSGNDEYRIRAAGMPRIEKPPDVPGFLHPVDTLALSTIADAIVRTLEDPDVDDRIDVIDRHEIILTSPSYDDPTLVESQKQFDALRGEVVVVETRDPWDSNRTMRGRLVDRNALDVILNVKGRMVTVPMNFVWRVRSVRKREEAEEYEEAEYEEYDEEEEE